MNQKAWICMNCGKVVYFPSVAPETREVVCNHCNAAALEEIPQEQLAPLEVTA
ncbi:hypothetical protein [Methanolobus vulcani]|uniref:hypothetical protein n=1 Tax=Methanolobus vulcani TaxID=38026 RepID=UPI0012B6BB1A|nr:hypothetical protein [Methanolobus vulcani]